MNLMTMLERAQGGKLFSHVAHSLDLDEAETRRAMQQLCPAIAQKLKDRASEDEDLFQSLLDIIDSDKEASPLDDAEALTDGEALSDGNAILADVYGSRNDAMVALRTVADTLPERELSKLAPISATAVVAALAQANRPMPAAAMQPAAGEAGGGLLGTIIGAVISGAVRELSSVARRRSSYTKSRAKRRTAAARKKKKTSTTRKSTTSRRRTTSATIEDIFRDILGNMIK